jgi:catechol 2,3-dioxygenase-like lactoylglutathione lyase family enzyme
MIAGVGSVAVLVKDARKSAVWYRDKLGFEVLSMEGHGVFVRAGGPGGVLIHLCGRCDAWENDHPGGRTGIWLRCGEVGVRRNPKTGVVVPSSDPELVEKTYEELKRRGVEFREPLTTASWGNYAILADPDGNEFEIS